MTKLLPCPFCGAPDPEYDGGNFVQCRKCGGEVIVNVSPRDAEEAVRRWNTRASLSSTNQAEVNRALGACAAALANAALEIREMIVEDGK